jgi:hypothetical protein
MAILPRKNKMAESKTGRRNGKLHCTQRKHIYRFSSLTRGGQSRGFSLIEFLVRNSGQFPGQWSGIFEENS